jgi:hypothetical protein
MLKKGKAYNLNFTYKYSDQKLPVGGIRFNYLDFPEQKNVGPKLAKKFSFAYKSSSMDKGELLLQGSASNQNDKGKSSPEVSYAKGLILTSQLLRDDYPTVLAPHGYNPLPEYNPVTVNFYFDQGSAVLKVKNPGKKSPAEKPKAGARFSNQQMLDAYIASKNATRTVTITGMHSPEGRELKNSELSDQRAKAIEAYYRSMMKKLNYGKKADSIEFVTKALIQTWAPLKDSLKNNQSLSAEEKKSVLDVIDGSGTYVEQQAVLEKLPFYPKLLADIYPGLRLGLTEILTLKPKKSDAEISVIAKAICEGNARPGDSLSDRELAYAATLTPLPKEKESIYLAATKKNDSWQSHNNLGVIRLEMARKITDENERLKLVDKAITNLEISRARMETAEVYANLASAYLMKADLAKIDEIFVKGQKLTGNAGARKILNTIKGIVEARRGNYPAALGLLSAGNEDGAGIYNKGLTQILKKEWSAGYATLEEIAATGSKNPLVYYVQAIAAARQNKESEMAVKLKKAIGLDASLRDKAVTDLEFLNFRNKPGFQEAVK